MIRAMSNEAASALTADDHLILVDGSTFIFRAYHALPPLTRKSDGLPVGAVSGFCNMLWKLLQEGLTPEKGVARMEGKRVSDVAAGRSRGRVSAGARAVLESLDAGEDLPPLHERFGGRRRAKPLATLHSLW